MPLFFQHSATLPLAYSRLIATSFSGIFTLPLGRNVPSRWAASDQLATSAGENKADHNSIVSLTHTLVATLRVHTGQIVLRML